MTTADEVPIASASHRVTVLWIVNNEDTAPVRIQSSVGAAVPHQFTAFMRPTVKRLGVVETIAADHVNSGAHERLPLSVQIVGKPYDEERILQIGAAYEREVTSRKDEVEID